ncbi:septum formation family protein [Nocardioides ultimimeridianus]
MRPIRSLAAVATLACATASLVAGASTATAGPSSTPTEGSCHQLTYQQAGAYSDPQAPVSCDGPHDTITVKVAAVRADSVRTEAANQVLSRCYPAAAAAVGGWRNYVRSMYGLFVFVPTEAQWSAGARWVRCDVALHGAGRTLQPLPSASGLSNWLMDRETLCIQKRTTGYFDVPCTKTHRYRATATIAMSTWTSATAAATFARTACGHKYPHVDFFYHYPHSRRVFNWGDHYAVCIPHRTS